MKIFEKLKKSIGLIGLLILASVQSCAPDDYKIILTEIPVPAYAFSLQDEVIAFQAEGKEGTTHSKKVDVSKLNQYVVEFKELLVYEIDLTGSATLLNHSFENGFLQAKFTAGNQYVVYAVSLDPRLFNNYRALCSFRNAAFNGNLAPGVYDKLCLVILCSPNMLQPSDVVQEIPEFAPLLEQINLPPDLEFGGLGIKTRQISNSTNGLTDLCDRCSGYGRGIIPFDQCLPPEPIPNHTPPPQVRLINMIPLEDSGDDTPHSSPFLAVNLSDPSHVVASCSCIGTTDCPSIFISNDRGESWTYNDIIPNTIENNIIRQTIATSTNPGELFIGAQGFEAGNREKFIKLFKTDDYTASTMLEERFYDFPVNGASYVQASPNPDQRVYIGNSKIIEGEPKSFIHVSEDGGNSFTQNILNFRDRDALTGNSSMVKSAISGDGTVYVAHLEANFPGSDLIIVRDDNGGVGDAAFQDLIDSSDGIAGKIVEKNIPNDFSWLVGFFGFHKARLSLAVHPSNSQIVYVAWEDTSRIGDRNGIHIKESTDGGSTWSENLRYVRNAINPTLAVSEDGTLGFSYQAFRNGRWITILEQTKNAFVSRTNTKLASFSNSWVPTDEAISPFGDFMQLLAVEDEFWGIFVSRNHPYMENFPHGVTYHRLANFTTHTISDLEGNLVETTMDPFFFKVSRIP